MKSLIIGTLVLIAASASFAQQRGEVIARRVRATSDAWVDASVRLEVRPGATAEIKQSVPVHFVHTDFITETFVTEPARYNVPVLVGFVTYEVPVGPCEVVAGKGQSPLWDAYFSAPRATKAQALADAVKGIGIKTANKIVAARRFFVSKPRSWEAFSAEVNSATAAGQIASSAQVEILGKFAEANKINLGYAVRGANCQTRPVTDPVWDLVDYEMQTDTREVTSVPTIKATDYVWLEVNVSNPTLQSFETDVIVVSTDRRGNARAETRSTQFLKSKFLQLELA